MKETATNRLPAKPSTRQRLADFCGKGRSYDEAINVLLDFWGEEHKNKDETQED